MCFKVTQPAERGRDENTAMCRPGSHRVFPTPPRAVGAGGAIGPQSDFVQSWLEARPLNLLKCSETCWGKWSFELA